MQGLLRKRRWYSPKAEHFGDLRTADHKILSEEVNRVTIIDMPWWCKTWLLDGFNRICAKQKLPRKRRRACKSSWSRQGSLDFGKACEDLSWNHCTSTPHRSETNGIAERAVRRVKEGTSAVLLQPGLDENWWADSMECCETRKISCLMGRHPMTGGSECCFNGPVYPVWSNG